MDGLAKGKSFQEVLQGLDTQAQAKIKGGQTTVSNILSGTNPNPSGSLINAAPIIAPDGNRIIITD